MLGALTSDNNTGTDGSPGFHYGEQIVCTDTLSQEYRFTGKEHDPETGNDYFGARYYSSAMGRFLTPDWAATPVPIPYAVMGNPQTLNLYSYVENNPITGTDPDGHCNKGDAGCTPEQQAADEKQKREKEDKALRDFLAKASQEFRDFTLGAARGYDSSASLGIVGSPQAGDSMTSLIGQTFGSLYEGYQAGKLALTGAAIAGVGGAGAPETGGLSAAVPVGSGLAVVGVTGAAGSVSNLLKLWATANASMQKSGTGGAGGGPKQSPNFRPPTNPPSKPPTSIPSGWRVRTGGRRLAIRTGIGA